MDYLQDWEEIEATFHFDYNIDLVKSDISYRKFEILLGHCSKNSPMGRLIQLRTWKKPSKDPKIDFEKNMREIRNSQMKKRLK